ncbi:Twin-arginine translocation pathway signal [Streptomyces sp. NBC_01433]|uniref:Twin-arginine translocation pathway signal n=1 Tax=Streptomyces sp. NBC_01433 TaxID=2903864 RepID=UPI00225851FB|nr:Twin-arginine translocation pathway signal [Streptomyces sp. NBC_01433]MCX4682191.1 Twin-arginine translocation pathway signal [Streptomyces sp. NBC_01433]
MGVTRGRRAEIQREASRIRAQCQRNGHTQERIVTTLRSALPELTALEAWRLALGWSRPQAVREVAAVYRADGLLPPGLTQALLCRYEHEQAEPGTEYRIMISRAYGARPEQLGLETRGLWCSTCAAPLPLHYGQRQHEEPSTSREEAMTTASGLPAIRESVQWGVLDAPEGSASLVAVAEAAVEHYALHYSKHAPAILHEEVRATRSLLSAVVATADQKTARGLRRQVGWLSALLGNLAYHLDDRAGARAHLTLAGAFGESTGDATLTAWSSGALSMVATARCDWDHARGHAEHGLQHAPPGLRRAQLLGWALLPTLAALGHASQADDAVSESDEIMQTAVELPGRFGYDRAEHRLHVAEAHLTLERYDRAAEVARTSIAAAPEHTPGWVAATLVLALAEARDAPEQAVGRALDILNLIPPARLRATARSRLARLERLLITSTSLAPELTERLRTLPAPIRTDGTAA